MLNDIISLCKRRGFIFQSSELYGGINGFWDYGPLGVELKNNIKQAWWQDMMKHHNELTTHPGAPSAFQMTGVDTSIIASAQIFKVSGHYDLFHDEMVDCKETKRRYRYDHIKGRWAEVQSRKAFITILSGQEDEDKLIEARAKEYFQLKSNKMNELSWVSEFQDLKSIKEVESVLAPDAKALGTLTEPKEFNLMFKTHAGAVVSDENSVFLRPETAQGIFVNFRNVLDNSKCKLPFGIAQIGKSFRNEITPRHFIFRSREFEQMEIEFFCHPAESEAWYKFWRKKRYDWLLAHGLSKDKLIMREHHKEELSHYSTGTADIEYAYPFLPEGEFGELEGVAHRGDFDLKSHMLGKLNDTLEVELDEAGKPKYQGSGKNLQFKDPETGESFLPHVIEPSIGVERLLLAILCDAYHVDTVSDEIRTSLRLHPRLAPIKATILPLIKKDQLTEIAQDIYGKLKKKFNITYDESGSVGKRYRRSEEIGVPICITIDFDTLEDGSVTFRHRDSTKQWRVKIEDCESELEFQLENFTVTDIE